MKNKILCFFYLISILLINNNFIFSQSKTSNQSRAITGWTCNNPFKTDVFVENHGQFDSWAKSSLPIKYAVNNSDKIIFTKQGVIFKLEKSDNLSEEEKEKSENQGNKEIAKRNEIYHVSMNWEGINPDAELIAVEQTEGYYTYGVKGLEELKAKGYRKLLYKNLYPNIDVEYIIPEKGGIKYKLILYPGADVKLVKMSYSGDIENLKIDKHGNLVIETPAGDITDHAPESFYEKNNSKISSSFDLNSKTVSFLITADKSKTIIIDPWTTTPTSLFSNNAALDIDYDKYGNVFFSGGSAPFKLSKYSSTGVFLWTFNNPINYWGSNYYSKFCVLNNSGTSFIGEALGSGSARIMKINNNGTLNYTSASFGSNNEIWRMFYNNCSKQLIAFGGGTNSTHNVKIIADTNLSSCVSKNFNGAVCSNNCNDIACVAQDNNGDFYAILTSVIGCAQIEGHLMKSLYSTNYSPPCAFDVQTYYKFQEGVQLQGISGQLETVRANALTLNSSYLFSYDGKILKAWNKTNGNLLDSVIVDNSYTSGKFRVHEGIDVDECNNVYVGGSYKLHVYSFSGTSFTALSPITTNISNEVHDIKLDRGNGNLYICGNGFVTEMISPILCNLSPIVTSFTITTDSCSYGNACIHASGGAPPYSYQWSNGSTDSCIMGVPNGVYKVYVSDNSCVQISHLDTVTFNSSIQVSINPNNIVICTGDSVSLIASSSSSSATYSWNNGVSGNTINVSPAITTSYTVTASDNSCYDTASVTVNVNSSFSINLNPSVCQGDTIFVGNHIYLTNGIYRDTLTTLSGCDSIVTLNLNVIQLPINKLGSDTSICNLNQFILNASFPNTTYQWQDGSTNPILMVSQSGLYWVKSTIGSCSTIDSINVTIIDCEIILEMPNIITPNGDGLNDYFIPSKIKNILKMHTQIFNRWGTLIYETDKLNIEWDGKYNDKFVSDGVYYWIINYTSFNKKENVIKGSLTVMR